MNMLGVISNPKKKVQIDLPKNAISAGVENIKFLSSKYDLIKKNSLINQFTFSALEFLSAGVYIDIEVNSITDNSSEVTIEVRRKVGSFDKSHEVALANTHISALTELLNRSLTTDISEEIDRYNQKKLKQQEISNKLEENKKNRLEYKDNNPIKYYSQQVLFWMIFIAIAYVVFMYLKNN